MRIQGVLADPRRRVILITIVTAAILLALVVALIVTLVSGKSPKLSSENTNVAIATPVDEPTTDNTSTAPAEDTKLEPVANTDDTGIVTVKPTEPTQDKTTDKATDKPAKSEMPKTGPASILPLALLTGSLTAFAVSRRKVSA